MNSGTGGEPKIGWTEVELRLLPGQVELAALLLNQAGAPGVVQENAGDEVILRTAFPADDTVGEKVTGVRRALDRLSTELNWRPPALLMRPLKDVDWSQEIKKHFQPFVVGETLWVGPPWHVDRCPSDRAAVVVNPGLAFGTGYHATTRMCLEAMESFLHRGDCFWDVGCGSGILSVAACRLGAGRVKATDVDPQAIEAARDNLELNGLEEEVKVVQAEGMEQAVEDRWNVVASNVHLEYALADGGRIFDALKAGGRWIVSGFLREQSEVVRTLLSDTGFREEQLVGRDEWGAAVAVKPSIE